MVSSDFIQKQSLRLSAHIMFGVNVWVTEGFSCCKAVYGHSLGIYKDEEDAVRTAIQFLATNGHLNAKKFSSKDPDSIIWSLCTISECKIQNFSHIVNVCKSGVKVAFNKYEA